MEWGTWFVPMWVFFCCCCLVGLKKKKNLTGQYCQLFSFTLWIDLRHFHGGFPPVFRKTSKPTSIHVCRQFLFPFPFAFCLPRFTGSWLVGVCVCTRQVCTVCYLSIKLDLSCLHLNKHLLPIGMNIGLIPPPHTWTCDINLNTFFAKRIICTFLFVFFQKIYQI